MAGGLGPLLFSSVFSATTRREESGDGGGGGGGGSLYMPAAVWYLAALLTTATMVVTAYLPAHTMHPHTNQADPPQANSSSSSVDTGGHKDNDDRV